MDRSSTFWAELIERLDRVAAVIANHVSVSCLGTHKMFKRGKDNRRRPSLQERSADFAVPLKPQTKSTIHEITLNGTNSGLFVRVV